MQSKPVAASLPHWTLTWTKGRPGAATLGVQVGDDLWLDATGFRPAPLIRTVGDRSIIVTGSPIVGEKIDPAGVADALATGEGWADFVRRLNGQFLIVLYDRAAARLILINDRFASVPVYWADLGDRFVAATLYSDLSRQLRDAGRLRLNGLAMFEYVWLQRLLLDKTHDDASRYLMPASSLHVSQREARSERYWRPDFSKRSFRSEAEAGEEFTGRLQTSLRRRTSDGKRFGLFLSGGHDSRTLAAAFPAPFHCFTAGFSENYEVECARQIASAVHAPFHFLKLAGDVYTRFLDTTAPLCGGMYSVDNALFVGFEEEVQAHADVVFHGHGLDYMFHGMYLPARAVELFGRPTFFRRLAPLDSDLAGAFLHGIPYRLKGIDLMSLVVPAERTRVTGALRASVTAVIEDGRDVCATDYDRWEYLIVHGLTRHYSYPNIASKATCAEQRTTTFDNDLFDFYCALPAELRLYGQTLRYATRKLAPRLSEIPTGNWGIAAGASPARKTAHLVARKLLRHLTGNQTLRAPAAEDRTWPDRDRYLAAHPELQREIGTALKSDALPSALPFLDWRLIRERAAGWMATPSGGAGLLISLLSLQRSLEPGR